MGTFHFLPRLKNNIKYIIFISLSVLLTACGQYTASIDQSNITLTPASSTTLNLTITPKAPGVTGAFTLTTTGLPTGVTLTPTQIGTTNTLTTTPLTQTLTLTATNSTIVGTYPISIVIANTGAVSQTVKFNLIIGKNIWPVTSGSIFGGLTKDTLGNILAINDTIPATPTSTNAISAVNKYDSSGNLLWSSTSVPWAASIAVDKSNNVYVAGSTGYANTDRPMLEKLSPTGTVLWQKTATNYGGALYSRYAHVKTTPDGGVVVLDDNVTITKYDTNGNVTWIYTIPNYTCSATNLYCVSNGLIVDSIGNIDVIVSGITDSNALNIQQTIIQLSPQGTVNYATTRTETSNTMNFGYTTDNLYSFLSNQTTALDSANNLYFTAVYGVGAQLNTTLTKVDSLGHIIWDHPLIDSNNANPVIGANLYFDGINLLALSYSYTLGSPNYTTQSLISTIDTNGNILSSTNTVSSPNLINSYLPLSGKNGIAAIINNSSTTVGSLSLYTLP